MAGNGKGKNVLYNYVKWRNGRLQRVVTRIAEIDTRSRENLTPFCPHCVLRVVFVYVAHGEKKKGVNIDEREEEEFNGTSIRRVVSLCGVMKFSQTTSRARQRRFSR